MMMMMMMMMTIGDIEESCSPQATVQGGLGAVDKGIWAQEEALTRCPDHVWLMMMWRYAVSNQYYDDNGHADDYDDDDNLYGMSLSYIPFIA